MKLKQELSAHKKSFLHLQNGVKTFFFKAFFGVLQRMMQMYEYFLNLADVLTQHSTLLLNPTLCPSILLTLSLLW